MLAQREHAGYPNVDLGGAAPVLDKNGKPLRGKAAPPYVENGVIIGRFKFIKMIGGGGFGQIYRVVHIEDGNLIAAGKIEPQGQDQGRMILECQVLVLMRGKHHFPTMYCSGDYGRFNFIIMELLGRNLTDIRKRTRNKRMSVISTFKIGIQSTDAFETLHREGYVHRDIKPSNMCVGHADRGNTVYLVDFGMARRFLNKNGNNFRPPRHYAAFRGTMRYVSIRVHERREQTPTDDLISLYYTLIELCEGSLPWRLLTDHDEILTQKLRYDKHKLFMYTPKAMEEFYEHINNLSYNEMPNYDKIREIFQKCLPYGVRCDDPFDWDEDVSSCYHD
ncbi:unnamed protein product, partial [Mesorhabditis belari]|uniref:non-specific serine/threonine protein kinase n=1 Tax=Mesorhabditis belari TaxID=2138241 RepID=A0AAF3F532_9BILA